MKAGATPELIALLRGPEPVLMVELYEITLADGTVLRYTTADVPIPYGGHTYGVLVSGRTIEWDHSQAQYSAGLQADTLNTTCYADLGDLIGGLPFHAFLDRGGFSGAYLILRRAYYAYESYYNFLTIAPVGVLWHFSGRDPEVTTGGLKAEITWKSPLYLLDAPWPRNLYESHCGHSLYNPGCGVNRDDFRAAGAVQPGSTAQVLQTILPQAAGWFDLGKVQFISGALSGTWRTVARHSGDNTLTLVPPLLAAPAPGDQFYAWAGCCRTKDICQTKFNNLLRFMGEPDIPQPEVAH